MAGGADKPGGDKGPLAGEDDLDLELEKWTDAFDALIADDTASAPPAPAAAAPATARPPARTSDVPPRAPLPAPAPTAAEIDTLFGEAGEFGEAMGDLLGAPPPPLAEPEPAEPSPAVRPVSRPSLRSLPSLPPPKVDLPPAPTDDEIFGIDAQKEFGEAIAGEDMTPPPGERPTPQPAPGAAAGEFGGSTRIADPGELLLAEAAGDTDAPTRKADVPLPGGGPPSKPSIPARRGPAVVRRDELHKEKEKERAKETVAAAPRGDYDEPQSTRIADAGLLEQFAAQEPSEELRFDQQPPGAPGASAVSVELDDSFYDDIEIGSSASKPASTAPAAPQAPEAAPTVPDAAVAPPAPAPTGGGAAAPRRASPHVVRRNTPGPGVPKVAPPSPSAPVRAPAPTPSSGPIELDGIPVPRLPPGRVVDDDDEPEIEMIAGAPDEAAEAEEEGFEDAMESAPTVASRSARASVPVPLPTETVELVEQPAPASVAAAPVAAPEEALEPGAPPERWDEAPPELELAPEPSPPPQPEPAGETGVVRVVVDQPDLAIDPGALRFPEADQPTSTIDGARELLGLLDRELALASDAAVVARLRFAAAQSALAAGDLALARDHLEEALNADPGHVAAARALRRLCCQLGDLREAIRWLDVELGLIAEGPEREALASYRADLLVAAGEQDLARVAFGELLDRSPHDVRALMAQIELTWADERDEELPEVLLATADRVADPGLGEALAGLAGRVLARSGRLEAARAAFARAGQGRSVALARARLELQAGRIADAARLEESVARGADAGLAAALERRRAVALAAAGDGSGALTALEQARAAAPEDPVVLTDLADAYARAERPGDAVATLEALARVEPTPLYKAAALRRAAALYAGPLADPGRAAAALRAAGEADPADADAAADLEAACLRAGDVDGAAQLQHATASADPLAAPWAHLRAAHIYEGAGRLDDAVRSLEAAHAAAPDSATIAESLARVYARAGRRAELARLTAARAAEHAGAADPASLRVRAARAAEAAAGADPAALAAAAAAWARAAEGEGGLYARLAAVRLAERAADLEALGPALVAAAATVHDPALAADLALRRAGLAADGEADAALERALALDPLEPRVHAHLDGVEGAGARWEDVARRAAERADALARTVSPEAPWAQALTYEAAAILEERADAAGRVVELVTPLAAARPGFVGARVLLERAHRTQGDPGALAAELGRSLGIAAPGEDAPPPVAEPPALRFARLVALGELCEERVGDPHRALVAYARALELRPLDPVARAGFARACEAAGELRPLAEAALADLKRAEDGGTEEDKIDAYEELARIDGDLRGDHASATLAWETIVEHGGTRLSALRALEKLYAAEGRDADLLGIYRRLEPLLDAPRDAGALALARARLEDATGAPSEALASARRALAAQPGLRLALFRLESRAREAGPSDELAALEERIATFFTGDPRAQATFLTRAGEHLADLGRPADAGARFRAATDAMPGHVVALRAWRRVAVAAGAWAEVVEAAEREAAAASTDAARARLYHLAGVVAMDKALDGERATHDLRRVLALDPRHDDALVRLRTLFDEQGRYEDLAQLLGARLEHETDRARQSELHAALARVYRDFLADRDRAKTHLRAVIQRDPTNLGAIAALSDIAWEQGQWQEAADALIQRARLEKQPRVLKEIYYRLGLIYAERLPDARWAVKSFERVLQIDPQDDGALEQLSRLAMQTGDWRLALGATERLIGLDTEPAQKIEHLHRAAKILREGFKDDKRAEEALRLAVDADPTDARTLPALCELYAEKGDRTSLRVHLDRVAGQMRLRLRRDAHDGVAYRVISRAMAARAGAGIAGSVEVARCAAELAHALGAAEEPERALAAEALRAVPSVKNLGSLAIDEALFHPTIPNGFRQIFRLLHETLAKRYASDLRRWGVGKNDKLPRSGHPVRDLAAAVARELGVGDVDVYVSSAQPTALGVELTEPLSLIVGAHLAHAEKAPQVRFAVGRALKLAASYMGVPARLTPEELGALLAGIIRQYDPSFSPPGISAGLVGEEQQKLGRLISKRLRDEVYPFASELAGTVFDARLLWAGVQHTGNRAGLIVSGSALASLVVLLRVGNYKDIASSRGDALVEELMRYAVSEEHAEVRRTLPTLEG